MNLPELPTALNGLRTIPQFRALGSAGLWSEAWASSRVGPISDAMPKTLAKHYLDGPHFEYSSILRLQLFLQQVPWLWAEIGSFLLQFLLVAEVWPRAPGLVKGCLAVLSVQIHKVSAAITTSTTGPVCM